MPVEVMQDDNPGTNPINASTPRDGVAKTKDEQRTIITTICSNCFMRFIVWDFLSCLTSS